MTLVPMLVAGGLVALWFLVWWVRDVRAGHANQRLFVLYSRVAEQLHDALAREDITWDQFVLTMNTLREVYNEDLRGSSRTQYLLPMLSTTSTPAQQSRRLQPTKQYHPRTDGGSDGHA